MTSPSTPRRDAEEAARDHLLWLDLETTGSDETKDCIIEVGCILTTDALEEVAEWECVVRPTAEGFGRLMLNPVVRSMHASNGLLEALDPLGEAGHEELPRPDQAAKSLLTWLALNDAKKDRTVLAGSGVGHFDRRFIARWMPQVDRFLRYWCIDIGVVRRAHGMWVGTPVSSANDAKTHRALDDARCHLAEARAFKALWCAS